MDNREGQGGALSRRPQGSLSRSQGSGLWTNPWREMEEMQRRMDALFGRVFGFDLPDMLGRVRFGAMENWAERGIEPDVDLYENDNEFTLRAALPGVNPQDIRVEATEDSITLSAESRSPFETQAQGQEGSATSTQQTGSQNAQTSGQQTNQPSAQSFGQQTSQQQPIRHRQSRYSGQTRFYFTATLPSEIKPNEVRANFRHGMLELQLPKSQPQSRQSVPIQIHADGGSQSLPTGSQSGTTSMTGTTGQMHEGAPTGKMGPSYAPNAGEDHTTQAQAAGERTNPPDHQRRVETGSTPDGQTSTAPAQPTAGAGTGTSGSTTTGTGQP